MDEEKRSVLIHYITKFIPFTIGLGVLFLILFMRNFQFSLGVASLWIFMYKGILFTYWLWINNSKVWEKGIVGLYFIIVKITISSSFASLRK